MFTPVGEGESGRWASAAGGASYFGGLNVGAWFFVYRG